MARMDAHVHTKHSDHPSEWFLQRLGAAESYTEPEAAYRAAKARGMDYVAITDHNRIEGALQLRRAHPADVVVGVEATAYFPEDGCKVHVLLYGITEEQFDVVQGLRQDIYRLRDYVREQDIAHSVAHAMYAVNDRLTVNHLEKLLVLFDVFEGINGSRDQRSNTTMQRLIAGLDQISFAGLCRTHRLEPFGERSWHKGVTGGSDDHAGLLVGRTYTVADADSPEMFVEAIRSKATACGGRHNDHRTLAFALYKIACDFSAAKGAKVAGPLVEQVNDAVFAEPGRVRNSLVLRQKRALSRMRGNRLAQIYLDALHGLRSMRNQSVDRRLDAVFEAICDASDEVLRNLVTTVSEELRGEDIGGVVSSISSALPAAFLAVPFFSTMQHMNRSAGLLADVRARFGLRDPDVSERILWFSDTVDDLNGVSVTLNSIAREARRREVDLRLVVTGDVDEPSVGPERIVLPAIGRFELPYYAQYRLEIPSVMRSLEFLHGVMPTRIYVSTPGPTGLLGMLAAKLLNVPCTAVYHTDFTRQAERITEDSSASGFLEPYTRWFYSLAEEIRVPSRAYIQVLAERGLDPRRMSVFRRAVDTALWSPRVDGKHHLAQRWGVDSGPVLVYTGRLSREKGLEFLLDVFARVRCAVPETWLVIAGDGPAAEELRKRCADEPRVVFTGRLEQDELATVVSGADALVFPSTTDTFGMSVLEAQACGVPAIVSDAGGPQEIVIDGVTGFVATASDLAAWTSAVTHVLAMAADDTESYELMSRAARTAVLERFGWDAVFRDILEGSSELGSAFPEAQVRSGVA